MNNWTTNSSSSSMFSHFLTMNVSGWNAPDIAREEVERVLRRLVNEKARVSLEVERSMSTYVTKQGDTWDLISYRIYPQLGKEMCMDKLIEANHQIDTVIFPAGVTLTVPDVEAPETSNLSLWKR